MILTAHQPAYLPWLGYFDKIIRSDIFIFLDSVQFEKNSFTNRNKIKTPQGFNWLTIPVITKGHTNSTLRETRIDNKQNWKRKHLNSIYQNYKKSPRFDKCYSKIEVLYKAEYKFLSDLCWDHLVFWLKEFGLKKKLIRSSELPIDSNKSKLVLDLCVYFKADYYISGSLGKGYLQIEDFQQAGTAIEFQDYQHPIYPQLYGEFVSNMGIIDFWMNTDQVELIKGRQK